MLKFNTYIFYIGIFLTATGIIIGFPFLFWGDQDVAMFFLTMIAPLGFTLFFAGFIGSVALRPHDDRLKSNIEDQKKAREYQKSVPD